MVYHWIIGSLQHLQNLNLDSNPGNHKVPSTCCATVTTASSFNKDSKNILGIYLHPTLYKFKGRLCNQRAEKRDKKHKMDKMNVWWITHNPVTCADVGIPSFKNGQTKRWRNGMYACMSECIWKQNNWKACWYTEKEAQFYLSEIWGYREQLLNVNRVPSD